MKVLFFGDIYGRVGRKAFLKELPSLKEKYSPDFIIVNVDNITSGRGAVESHVQLLSDYGVDVCTGGDHIFDNFEAVRTYLESPKSNLLRPSNIYETWDEEISGVGHKVFEKDGKKLLVIHLLGQIFMNHKVYNPFHHVEEVLQQYWDVDGICVDFHKEATSEVQAMAMYLDGRVTFVWGTHTHVQTNDDHILPGETGMISDVGMNGPLYSVIGADFSSVRRRFLTGIEKGKIEQSLDKRYVVSWVYFETEKVGIACKKLEKIRIYWDLG